MMSQILFQKSLNSLYLVPIYRGIESEISRGMYLENNLGTYLEKGLWYKYVPKRTYVTFGNTGNI